MGNAGSDASSEAAPDGGSCSAGCPPGSADASEVCDALDNDCDGAVDEMVPCGSSSMGACQMGVQQCVSGQLGECEGAIEPEDEVCDGDVDENCNGSVDEGCDCTDGAREECMPTGACASGMRSCADGAWGMCTGAVTCGGSEVCQNARCVDCMDGATRPCGNTLSSPCKRGTQSCRGGSWDSQCVGEVTPEAELECNGVDEDCDGRVDDCRSGMTCMGGHCSAPLPRGDYMNTCEDCWSDGSTLHCDGCLNDGLSRVATSISIRCEYELSNCNGRLVCRPTSDQVFAAGDFDNSCPGGCNFNNCAGSNGVLTCTGCTGDEPSAPPTGEIRYDGPPCPTGIHNCNGMLKCNC